MIGIICALQAEIALLEKEMTGTVREKRGGFEFITGILAGKETVMCVCGVGKVFAASCCSTMADLYHPDVIINTGVAGTLSRELSIMDIAIADRLCQHDMDTTPLGDEPGLISGINKVYFECSPDIVEGIRKAADEAGAKYRTGTIASGDQFVSTPEKKKYITETFGAIACEMEGAAIAQAAYIKGMDFAIIRAISDDADGNACEDYPAFVEKSAERSADILIRYISSL